LTIYEATLSRQGAMLNLTQPIISKKKSFIIIIIIIVRVLAVVVIPSQEAYCVSKTKSPNKKILLSSVLCSFKFSVITVWSYPVFAIIGSVFFFAIFIMFVVFVCVLCSLDL